MPTLFQSLQNQDLGQLLIIAEMWDLNLQAPDVRQGRKELAELILRNKSLIVEVVEDLPVEAQQALSSLLAENGMLSWHPFTQQFGEIREMGPGRRDREKPYLEPVSAAERLWYFGFIARAFFDTPSGPQEFAYIPDDLRTLLPDFIRTASPATPLSRPAAPAERTHTFPASDHILDHATTLLAALRMGITSKQIDHLIQNWPMDPQTLTSLLQAAGLISDENSPLAGPVREFLEAPRAQALAQLVTAWLESEKHDDLRLIPHLQAEGEWYNDPKQLRRAALELIRSLDTKTWWSLPALITSIQNQKPNFLRPNSDYDSWYLKDKRTEQYLRGFQHWEQVEGAYLVYLITGPMHWLGLIDLATAEQDGTKNIFRFSSWSHFLFNNQPPPAAGKEDQSPTMNSQGHIIVPRMTPRAARYLIARFCEWGPTKHGAYTYTLTPKSLEKARNQGLKIKHLVNLLKRYSDTPLPPNTLQALKRWQENGTQISFQQAVVLRVNHPDVLKALLETPAKRFLGTPLGPTTITVHPGALQQVRDTLIRLGYLSELDDSLADNS
ncbi:MAG: helicase-associated domain-containing protein [Anaerolineales bacterium]